MKNILLLVLAMLFFQCNSNKTNKQTSADEQDKFFVIPYEDALRNKKTIKLSEVAEDIKYIPLQTDSNCLLARKPEYHFTEQYIFVENRDHVLVFDYTGKFIRKIGTPGKGPNEIDLIRMAVVNEKDKIITVQTNWSRKTLYFSFDGTFIESVSVPDVLYMYSLGKYRFVAYSNGSQGFEDYTLRLTNRNNDTLSTVKNHFKWENKTGSSYAIGYWGFNPCYSYMDKYYFKTMYNDTVYTVTDNEFLPAYYIDLGKYRLPDDARCENPVSMDKFRRVRNMYYLASSVEAAGQVFITSFTYADSLPRNILYQSGNSESTFLVKEFGEASGFINDWDGGPEFWPAGNVNDQTLFMPVAPIELLNIVEEEDFSEKDAISPDRKKEFRKMVEGLKEEDNVVLMVVKMKINEEMKE